MIKKVNVVDNNNYPVENLYIEIGGNSFVSDRNGQVELKADAHNSVVKISFPGVTELTTTFDNIKDQILIDNGLSKSCNCNNDSLIEKIIQVVNNQGQPIKGVQVFSETALTNTITDENGQALVKVSKPDEFINIDADFIDGQALQFSAIKDKIIVDQVDTKLFNNQKSTNASAWFWGLFGLGLLWNHARNKNKKQGLSKPVKIVL